MSEPILVYPVTPGCIGWQDLDDLVEKLRSGGVDARHTRFEGEGFGVDEWYEIVAIWIGLEVGKAAINQVVEVAVGWARERFRRPPEEGDRLQGLPRSSQRRKGLRVEITQYEGNEGRVVEVVELEAEDADPVRRPPEGYERNARFRPSEWVGESTPAPAEDIAQELPTLPLPVFVGDEGDLLRENRARLQKKAGVYPVEAVLDAWLLIEAAAQAAAIRNSIDIDIGAANILRTLADRHRIPESVVAAAHTLQDLRARVAPRPIPGLSTAAAVAYSDTVARVVAHLAYA